jgi:hypothetical protein
VSSCHPFFSVRLPPSLCYTPIRLPHSAQKRGGYGVRLTVFSSCCGPMQFVQHRRRQHREPPQICSPGECGNVNFVIVVHTSKGSSWVTFKIRSLPSSTLPTTLGFSILFAAGGAGVVVGNAFTAASLPGEWIGVGSAVRWRMRCALCLSITTGPIPKVAI